MRYSTSFKPPPSASMIHLSHGIYTHHKGPPLRSIFSLYLKNASLASIRISYLINVYLIKVPADSEHSSRSGIEMNLALNKRQLFYQILRKHNMARCKFTAVAISKHLLTEVKSLIYDEWKYPPITTDGG